MITTGSIGTIFIVIDDIHHFCVHLVDTRISYVLAVIIDNKIALALLRVPVLLPDYPRREIKMNMTSKNEDDVKISFIVSVCQHAEKSSTTVQKAKTECEQQQKSRCRVQIVPSYSRI